MTSIETTAVTREHLATIEERLGAPLPDSAKYVLFRRTDGLNGEEDTLTMKISDADWRKYVDGDSVRVVYDANQTFVYKNEVRPDGTLPILDFERDDDMTGTTPETITLTIRYFNVKWEDLGEPTQFEYFLASLGIY